MTEAPLQGLKVLDLSKVLAGPLCAQSLGDMGADVIKVETLGAGDDTREWPPFRNSGGGNRAGTVFLSANRNKRSIAINLRSTAGRAVVHKLVQQCDVVIESFGPGVAAKLAVDAGTLRALNPRLVYCTISGYGSVGPMKTGKGYDVILQAFCGMISITGEADGGPVRSPFSPIDQATGMHALTGILAALLERGRTNLGKTIEASLFDTATSFLSYFIQAFWERGTEPQKVGAGHESLCPYQAFATLDKPLILGVANDPLWRAFCKVADMQNLAQDPRFRTNADRVDHRMETIAIVQHVLLKRSRDEWLVLLEEGAIPCAPIHTLRELTEHPHTLASGMLQKYVHPSFGEIGTVSMPLRFDGSRLEVTRPAPMHAEHGREILLEAGFSDDNVSALVRESAVQFRH